MLSACLIPYKTARHLLHTPPPYTFHLLLPQSEPQYSPEVSSFLRPMAPSIITSSGTTYSVSDSPSDGTSPVTSGYQAFDHILWYVGNAKQAASYYVTRMGFKHVAYVCLPFVG